MTAYRWVYAATQLGRSAPCTRFEYVSKYTFSIGVEISTVLTAQLFAYNRGRGLA